MFTIFVIIFTDRLTLKIRLTLIKLKTTISNNKLIVHYNYISTTAT